MWNYTWYAMVIINGYNLTFYWKVHHLVQVCACSQSPRPQAPPHCHCQTQCVTSSSYLACDGELGTSACFCVGIQ